MPDLFGKKQLGRATTGGRFYATPTERVEAGAIYFPDESSLLFGVAEYTVEAGNLGAFATEGTFVFEKPNDWLDSLGRKVFFRPSTGEIVNQDRKGDVLIGFQVFANVPDDKLGVVLTQGENSVVIIVTSTADSGAGSLRQAIADASDGDVILFDSDVFPLGQTTSILLSSYITVNKSVSIYGGEADGNGGYTSGASKSYYVYRDVDGVKTKVVISTPDEAQEGEIVLFDNVCRVALDGQATQDPDATDEWTGWTGSRVMVIQQAGRGSVIKGLALCNGVSGSHETGALIHGNAMIDDLLATFIDCAFVSGVNTSGAAGGISCEGNWIYSLSDCNICACKAQGSGGGVYVKNFSNVTFDNCVIADCKSPSLGGGVCSVNTSQNTLNDCNISNCSATNGGGVCSTNTSQNTLNDCTFDGCSATYGGGVYSNLTSQNTLNGCTISGCSATNGGGAICSTSTSQNTLIDCTITDCSSSQGQAVYINSTSQITLTRCRLTRNNLNSSATPTIISDATAFDTLILANGATLNIVGNITTVTNGRLYAATITIADGAALTLTDTATIGAAKFTSEGRGYLAVGAGIDTSAATLTGVVLCAYGAGLESFAISADGATWTAQDLTTPILLEEKGDGAVWTTLADDATGGSYSDSFEIGTTLRAFDGVRFFVASLDAYWQVEPFVVASNGGGGAGDVSPSWTVSDATITPNAEEV